jgi:hypothetical protein
VLVREIHGNPAVAFGCHAESLRQDAPADMGQDELTINPNGEVDALRVVSEVRFELIHVHPPDVAPLVDRARWWRLVT